jgi:serine protease Do
MRTRKLYLALAVPLALAIAALACGAPAASPTNTPAPRPTITPAGISTPKPETGAINSVEDVKSAVIQVEAQGSFVDPEVGTVYNAAGRGSGFIIDPSGIAVTNNHVVTGAALIKVWVGGERDPRNARILGVSECSDLAVIDIEGDGYPYLEWRTQPAKVGLDIYVAGFPLGDPEYTLTRGVISKEKAGGRTSWASVDHVLEYDATTNPGNSGGPVIDQNGKVVAVHYAGRGQTRQAFGIAADIARGIVEQLRQGQDVESIGINGQAVASEDGSLTGIWVASVKSGSPADKAGVRGGDILTTMEGLVLATDGTMGDYCDILSTRSPSDVLSIEVLRFSTQEVLSGQLNGRELAVTYSFASNLGGDVPSSGTSGGSTAYSRYVQVTDDSGAIVVEIPAEWSDINGSNWVDGNDVIGAGLSAAPSLQRFNERWDEPGMFFGVSDDIARLGGYVQVLDIRRDSLQQSCTFKSRNDYSDAVYEGKYDVFSDCKGAGNVYVVLSARPKSNPTAFLVLLEVNVMTDADLEALDHIYQTFNVVGSLP